MTPPARPRLSRAAQYYLAQVAGHLRDLDRPLRSRLVAIAVENLAERPNAASFRELAADLGGPREYARELRDEAESAEPGTIDLSRFRRRRRRRSAIGVAIVLAAALVSTGTWWATWQADIQSNSLRVCDDAATPTQESCGQSGITHIDLAGIVDVTCHGTISITTELSSPKEVTVTGASLTGLEMRTGPDRPIETGAAPPLLIDGVQVWQNTDPDWDPQRVDWPVTVGSYPNRTIVTFFVTTCPPTATPNPGLSRLIESMEITYHALGRNRAMTIPLTSTVAVTTR